jgi:hypothetical protein
VGEQQGLSIRSFRLVFDLERRIHKIDRWRIPVPYGVPLRGIAYWAAALLVTIALGGLPLAGELTRVLPTPVRLVVLPLAVAYLFARVSIDGRPAHTALVAWARFRLSPSRFAGMRAVPRSATVVRLADVPCIPDERSTRYRGAVIEGPATVLLRYPPLGLAKRRGRGATLHVSQLPGPPLFVGKEARLTERQRMVVHG